MWRRLRDYRRRQQAILAAARERDAPRIRSHAGLRSTVRDAGQDAGSGDAATDSEATASAVAGAVAGAAAGAAAGAEAGAEAAGDAAEPATPGLYGVRGAPLNRTSPFYVGFLAGIGLLLAYGLVQALSQLGTAMTLMLAAFAIALSLNPLVELLENRGMSRGPAVGIVFAGLVTLFAVISWIVLPPLITQATDIVNNAPQTLNNLLNDPRVVELDDQYDLIARGREELTRMVSDGDVWRQVFGGVLGVGRFLASGVFAGLTILILTLYFITSLPVIKSAAYAAVPASRRARVEPLAEEIMRRVGAYAIGQLFVALVNAVFSYLMMMIVGIPFAAVLAVAVGLLGLVPMVGATAGAVLVAAVAVVDDPRKALIVIVYYIVYQQLENYALMPKIMQRTVSVPGALTIVAALVGATLMGMLGALLAIPLAAGLLLLYEEVWVPRQDHL